MSNLCSFIFETMPQVLLLLVKVGIKDHILLQQWLWKLALNLGTFNKNFETTNYSLERSN